MDHRYIILNKFGHARESESEEAFWKNVESKRERGLRIVVTQVMGITIASSNNQTGF